MAIEHQEYFFPPVGLEGFEKPYERRLVQRAGIGFAPKGSSRIYRADDIDLLPLATGLHHRRLSL